MLYTVLYSDNNRSASLLPLPLLSTSLRMTQEHFELEGWRFESESHPILSTRECDALTKRLKEVCKGRVPPALPGALFGRNRLTLKHKASGLGLSFDAEGAIICWARESARHGSGGLKVVAASQPVWTQAAKEMSAPADDYDWTFSSDYCGITSNTTAVQTAPPAFVESSFSTKVEYEAWLTAHNSEAGTKEPQWCVHKGSGLDMKLLRRRDIPILHYVDLPLYEDEMDDNGSSVLRVRLRVMPSFFFVLLRHVLRVDGVLIRQRETRIFHKFGAAHVLRVRQLAEAPLKPLRKDLADDLPDIAASHPNEQQAAEMLAMLPPKSESIEELSVSLLLSDGAAPLPSDALGRSIWRSSLGSGPQSDLLPDHGRSGMRTRITSQEALAAFKSAPAYTQLLTFIEDLAKSVTGLALTTQVHVSAPLQVLLDALQQFSDWVAEIPPIPQAMRCGNKAFVQWHGRLQEASLPLARRLLEGGGSGSADAPAAAETARAELAVYLSESFGSATRIDYGSGHELSFVAFLCAAERTGVFSAADRPAIVLRTFQQYLELVRKLQTTYWLEPAGSHGVWGLDDYQHLPFFFGAAQLSLQRELAPACVHDEAILEAEYGRWMYLAAIRFIRTVKTGPFGEHSPMLDDISALDSWARIRDGLLRMYAAEVLGKLPVVQHLPFGRLLPWSDAPDDPPSHARTEPPSPNGVDGLITSSASLCTPPSKLPDNRLAVLAKIKADKAAATAAKADDTTAQPDASASGKTQVRRLTHASTA